MSNEEYDQYEEYANDPAFHEFLDREFDLTARVATLEELADFAFGSMDEAVRAYRIHRGWLLEDDHETT